MRFFLLISLLISSQRSLAVSICSDLAAHTCAEGQPNDGTGTSVLSDAVGYYNYQINRLDPRIKSNFVSMLSGDKAKVLRSNALVAYGFEQEPACVPSSDTEKCLSLLGDQLIETYKVQEFGRNFLSGFYMPVNAEAVLKIVGSDEYKALAKKLLDEQNNSIPKARLDKIEKVIFPRTKALLIARIQSLPIGERDRARMLSKVESIRYRGLDCLMSGADQMTEIARAFIPNAQYDPTQNSFGICGGYLNMSTSEFNLVHTIAHEISHSIDPCNFSERNKVAPLKNRISNERVDDTYLRKNFLRCLRSKDSAEAKTFDEFQADATIEDGERVYNDTARYCGSEQSGETVADWFAAEIVGEYSEKHFATLSKDQKQIGIANILRPACYENRPDQNHPGTTNRLNGILLVQPKIRSQMGCVGDAPKRYCDIDNPASLQGNLPKEKPLKSGSQKSKNKAVK